MQALILAAGKGTRLGHGVPKCLSEVGGRPLIDHQLEALAAAGVDDTVMVIGYQEELVRAHVGDRATYVVNERFAETNSLYSFMLAREAVHGAVLVMNCDVIFHPFFVDLLNINLGSALAFDSSGEVDDEQMNVAMRDGWLLEMRKDLPHGDCCGENVGLIRLDRHAAREAFRAASALVAAGGERDWLASAINLTAPRHHLKCLDVAGLPWTEIDFPEDIERAPLESERVRLVRHPDVIPTLFAADLLITDASSVANEYALLDRPIVFLDVPELLAAAGGEGSALDLETWGRKGGEVVAEPAAVAGAVQHGLAHPGERSETRREMVGDLFYNPGRATAAALEWLRTQLGLRERLPSLAS